MYICALDRAALTGVCRLRDVGRCSRNRRIFIIVHGNHEGSRAGIAVDIRRGVDHRRVAHIECVSRRCIT